jgi:hypothetical protein
MTQKLRRLIEAGLKTYDDDIKDEIFDELDIVEKQISVMNNQNTEMSNFIIDRIHNKHEIDFGVAKLYYGTHKGGSILLEELMQVIERRAMVTPLQDLINAIKRA